MLTSADVAGLFKAMRSTYGHKWPHREDALPYWLAALKSYEKTILGQAVGLAIQQFPYFPRPFQSSSQ